MNENGMPPKQINRVAKPIQLDANGNVIETPTPAPQQPIQINPQTPKKETKKNTPKMIIIIILLIIIAILCAIVVYVILPQMKETEPTEPIEPILPNTSPTDINNIFKTITINNNQSVTLDGVFPINNDYQISTVNNGSSLDIFVNNQKITSSKSLLPTIGTVDDLILFTTQDNENRTTKLYIVDKTGKIILDLYNIPDANGMVIMPDSSSIIYNSVTLVLLTSRIQNNLLITSNNYGETSGIDICNVEELNRNNIGENYIVMGTYSLEYLGNHNFTKLTRLNGITLKDYKEQHNLCN